MKHIYIIGNGFDIFTGLHTRYVEFRHWLEQNYPFIYENMSVAYEMDGEWWNDFETQLGKLNVRNYVKKFTPPDESMNEILDAIEKRKSIEKKYNLPPSLYFEKPCANRLKGLLDVLQYCFERWVEDCQSIIINPNYTRIERDNSFFINFNYTDVLERLYKIPDKRVLHIHGRASTHEHLVFGHGSHLYGDITSTPDEEHTCFELNRYEKNPFEFIYKHKELPDFLYDAEYVHIFGFSFSQVDEDYLDWIVNKTPITSKWEVSWYSDIDKQRINDFVLNHWSLKDRISLIQLQPIEEREALS